MKDHERNSSLNAVRQVESAASPAEIAVARFPKDFLWGKVTSSY
jgi:hypothetical protein